MSSSTERGAVASLADEILAASEATLAGAPAPFLGETSRKKKPNQAKRGDAIMAHQGSDETGVSQDADSSDTMAGVEPNVDAGRVRFTDLDLREEVRRTVLARGYEYPTEIQAAIIPHISAGRDVLAQSQTGTGKTAAFALPILSAITMQRKPPQVLVLAPTRELAIQVANSFRTYAEAIDGFSVASIVGGQDYDPQLRQLRRGCQVVVGTPGRLIDHVRSGALDLSQLKCLVLDEADEMLNMGFLEDVKFILEQSPPDRQVALFSATLPEPIRRISKQYLRNPARVTIANKTVTAESIGQRAVFVPPREKIDALRRFLEVEATDGVIIFTKTKDATISVAESLSRQGFSAVALNGDMPQKVRERAIEQLKSSRLDILVATDVAARGLDVPRISHVFNFDLPHDSESYVHRIGRTGRAGREGQAIIFLTNAQRARLRSIERATKQPIEVVPIPSADLVNAARIRKFTERLSRVIGSSDLSFFREMLIQYANDHDQPMEVVAAALAEITQNGRPLLLKDSPKRNPRVESHPNGQMPGHRSRSREDRRSDPTDNGPVGRRREPRILGPVKDGMTRYRVEVGWRDGVKPANLVGAIANEAGIDGEFIGPIHIENTFATVDLPEGMPTDIYRTLQNTWVRGKKLSIRVDDGRPRQNRSGPTRKRSSNAKPRGRHSTGRRPHAKRS
ncbi:MAG: DEAD/DEAH box helicase [Planctomycetota bacterium]